MRTLSLFQIALIVSVVIAAPAPAPVPPCRGEDCPCPGRSESISLRKLIYRPNVVSSLHLNKEGCHGRIRQWIVFRNRFRSRGPFPVV